ncbi:hypothetical protein V1525DRAFT_413445, partial [Lipomyces kononenkoae]
EHRALGPLEYNGYKWFGTLRDAFFETYRETDAGILKSDPVVSSVRLRQFITEPFLSLTYEHSTSSRMESTSLTGFREIRRL